MIISTVDFGVDHTYSAQGIFSYLTTINFNIFKFHWTFDDPTIVFRMQKTLILCQNMLEDIWCKIDTETPISQTPLKFHYFLAIIQILFQNQCLSTFHLHWIDFRV